MVTQRYEWGVARRRGLDEAWREGFTQQEAEQWVAECVEMGMPLDAFQVIRRPVGDWEIVDETPQG